MSFNSSTSGYLSFNNCTYASVIQYTSVTMTALRVLLVLPLSISVLYLGHQRWRQQRSSNTVTHSDIFTYHVAAMELIWVLATVCLFAGVYSNHLVMVTVGMSASSIIYYGETSFHVLTCVERYLAVVHPITYMGLRSARGVRIRNICIGCVWLLSFGLIRFATVNYPETTTIPMLCILVLSIIIMSFCSLSVLCVLIRPGPGERGRERERVDQSKQRAFYTITVISIAVWLWVVGLIVSTAVSMSPFLSVRCLVVAVLGWFSLPSSLVSPLLYLYRAGKLSCFCSSE